MAEDQKDDQEIFVEGVDGVGKQWRKGSGSWYVMFWIAGKMDITSADDIDT